MTYTIVTPIVNDNNGFKDTGQIGFYRWQDVQCLAELFGQANSCMAMDAKSDGRGNWNQDATYSVLWPFFGVWLLGQQIGLDYSSPLRQFTWWDRMKNMSDVQNFPIPYVGVGGANACWLYRNAQGASPWQNFTRGQMTQNDALLPNAGTDAGTAALFGQGIDLKNDSPETGMNRPTMDLKVWTSLMDIVLLYRDASLWSQWHLWTLTWNSELAENWSYGQVFDTSIPSGSMVRNRDWREMDSTGGGGSGSQIISTGWSNQTFEQQFHWKKSAVIEWHGGMDELCYEWNSEEDRLDSSGQTVLQRNVPVPTLLFGQNCPLDREYMFVWKATFRDVVNLNTGLDHDITTTHWFYYIGSFTKSGVQNYTDPNGNDRGLCVKYTTTMAELTSQYSNLKNSMGWSIPQFVHQWVPLPQTYVQSQEQWLRLEFVGAYSLQHSKLTETFAQPM